MSPLLNLPDLVLDGIISYTLNLGTAATSLGSKRRVRFIDETTTTKVPALPLLRRINVLTSSALLQKLHFCLDGTPALRHFVNLVGEESLHRVRSVSVLLYSSDDYVYDPRDAAGSDEVIAEATSLLMKLPQEPRRLQIEPPYHPWPCFLTHLPAAEEVIGKVHRPCGAQSQLLRPLLAHGPLHLTNPQP